MLVIKCIGGALLGTLVGIVAWLAGAVGLYVLVGLATWDSTKGENAAEMAVLLVPLGTVVGLLRPALEDAKLQEAAARREAERREGEVMRRDDALQAERQSLSLLLVSSKRTFLSLRSLLKEANAHLERAESEFQERAFAPFWDQVENATNCLAAYHQGVTAIGDNARDYRARAVALGASLPIFDIPRTRLPDARPTAERLTDIVRLAQKDFEFATIFEQRRTNQLLYVGFGNLATAIGQMHGSIIAALGDLSSALDARLEDLVASTRDQTAAIEGLQERATEDAAARRAAETVLREENRKQSEMLDNIQRRRKPFP